MEQLDSEFLADETALAYAATDGVCVVDRQGHIISFSEAAARITGYLYEEVVGRPCTDLFQVELWKTVQRTIQEGAFQSNLHIETMTAEGDQLPLCVTVSPLRHIKGDIAGAVLTFRDVNEMRRLVERLSQRNTEILLERDKLNAILNSIQDGVFTIDEHWRITSFNRAAEVITGYTAEEAIGLYCRDIFRSVTCLETCPLRRTLATGESVYDAELDITTKEGRRVPISVNTALLYDVDGTVLGGVETFRDLSNVKALTEELEGRYSFHNIIGKSKQMQALYNLLEDVAETDATVLIQGASGTGKELVARAIHYNGPRRERPFIAVNCAALPESLLESELFGYEKGAFTGAVRNKPGRFERAHGGTLFLDEVGEMIPGVQAKLLRVLDSGEMERVGGTQTLRTDVRILAATNRDLLEAVEEGTFREDLYYRLNVISMRLPTLSERKEDISLLSDHFIRVFNAKTGRSIKGLSKEAMRRLLDHDWPGNVRELENAIEYAFVRCEGEYILLRDLPETLHSSIDQEGLLREKDPFAASERTLIQTTLEKVGGNRGDAAKTLGISRPTLWRKMKKHGLL